MSLREELERLEAEEAEIRPDADTLSPAEYASLMRELDETANRVNLDFVNERAAMMLEDTDDPDLPPPVIISPADLIPGIAELYEKGRPGGESTGWPSVDAWYTVRKRELTIVTGYPNHGKSVWLDNLIVNLARSKGWRFAIFSAENLPLDRYVSTFLEIWSGKPFRPGPTPRMTLQEVRDAIGVVKEHLWFINPELENRSIDNILKAADECILKHKIDAVVLDPWNELDHARPRHLREDEYISIALSKVRNFTRRNDVHFFIVAHPKTMTRDGGGRHPVPTMHDIKGGSEWNAHADNGVCVWRNVLDTTEGTDIHIQKVRFREVGRAGGCAKLYYEPASGRFFDQHGKQEEPWD